MKMYPDSDIKKSVIHRLMSKFYRRSIDQSLISEIEYEVHSLLLEHQINGDFKVLPIVHCGPTVICQKINKNMQWVDVYADGSLTINFLNPYTGEVL